MKKFLRFFWGILVVTGFVMALLVMIHKIYWDTHEFVVTACVSERTAIRAANVAGLKIAEKGEFDAEDIGMQIVYQLAKRSIVKVVVKDAVGSGIIWRIEDGVVIASNRHLLMKDVKAEIVFGSGESVIADGIGYSQQYDIGFVRIPEEAVTDNILRNIYEAVPVLYDAESEDGKTAFIQEYSGKRVLQMGAVIDPGTVSFSTGSVKGLTFVPLFNTNVLETACFSKAGMSGGGVFDEGGRFLGMISGGEVPEEARKKEAEISYSIPAALIASEYEAITTERNNQ
ncbi:MAG: serine protease [Lachnospiraceae bacterium]|nr:serine protease [Lachnospiraceae bacterium]